MPDPTSRFGADSGTPEDAIQLELFPPDGGAAVASRGVPREVARASVSPGWWPLIETLYRCWSEDDVVVDVCRERDGVLELVVTSEDEPGAFDAILARIRETVAHTCGCCGASEGRPYRPRLDATTRVVCDRCRERLAAGETYLAVADEFFRLDGSRRVSPATSGITIASRSPIISPDAIQSCRALPPDELRRVIREIRERMATEVVGHDTAVAHLALLGGLHVGGGLARGGRVLIVGPSGSGKSTLVSALRRALDPWALPWAVTSASDLSSPGWAGLTVGGLIDAALAGLDPASARAQRAVVVIDEIHHARIVPRTSGNTTVKRQEVLSSLLDLTGYGIVHLGDSSREWSSQRALVIAIGAFTDSLNLREPITTEALVHAGLPLELATRIARLVDHPGRARAGLMHARPAGHPLVDAYSVLIGGPMVPVATALYLS